MRRLWILPLCVVAAFHPCRSYGSDACPQFFPGGQAPALVNPKLGQWTTLLCSDAHAPLRVKNVWHPPMVMSHEHR